MAYATTAQMLERFDARPIGDMVDDTDQQVPADELLTNPVLIAMLDDASGDIDAALSVGGMYTAADLASLTGNSAKHLVRITCEIAYAYLLRRRGIVPADEHQAAMELAESHLERLRQGVNVFNVPQREDAALIDTAGPSAVTFENMNLIRDRTHNYFPERRPATWNQ